MVNITPPATLDKINDVCSFARKIGQASVVTSDADPDAWAAFRVLRSRLFPEASVDYYCGDPNLKSVRHRMPGFEADPRVRIHSVRDLNESCRRPLFLLDAARISQPNVGGPEGLVPDVVMDTHVGAGSEARVVALESHDYVATSSIVEELIEYSFGSDCWQSVSDEDRRLASLLAFGIHTDSGEGLHATPGDHKFLQALKTTMDSEAWDSLVGTGFFQKCIALYECALRTYDVNHGFVFVDLGDHIAQCRDLVGAVADRLMLNFNNIVVMATGLLRERGTECENRVVVSTRLNRMHRAFDRVSIHDMMAPLKEMNGGYGAQVNGAVAGGTIPTNDPLHVVERLKRSFLSMAKPLWGRLLSGQDELGFSRRPPGIEETN